MYRLKIATTALLVSAGLSGPASAGGLGGVGDAVGGLVGGAGDMVNDVANGVGNAVGGGLHGSPGSGTAVSVDASVGSTGKSPVGVSADVKAKVGKAVTAGICADVSVGGSAGSGCSGQTRTATQPKQPVATSRNPQPDSFAPPGGNDRAAREVLGADWLVGQIAYGADNVALGVILDVKSTARDGEMPTIVVQLDRNRKVQLRNAIASIRSDGVWLVVPANAVATRATGRMTRLAIPG